MSLLTQPANVPQNIQNEMKDTFGMVPSFARATTPDTLKLWWQEMRDFQMSDKTALSPKVKELIGLGVAAQIPCHYCVKFHTEAARLNGASDSELQEAIYMAGLTRQGSTILNGALLEEDIFDKEMGSIVKNLRAKMGDGGMVHAKH